jgi:hypothetical protein
MELKIEEGLAGSGPVMTIKQKRKSISLFTLEEARFLKKEIIRFIIAHKNLQNRIKKQYNPKRKKNGNN